jgi:acetyl-CoA carboxylase carboxyl transferase subunit beta
MKDLFRRSPKFFAAGSRRAETIPDKLWVKCSSCGELTYVKQLNDNLKVCKCGHHMRLSAHEWLGLLDPGSFVEEDAELAPADPLGFVSAKDNYAQKLSEYRERTGMRDAMLTGHGTLADRPLQVAISEFAFIGGSMGSVYGEKVARAAERAAVRRVPLLTITATGGARQHEGVLALMQMAKVNMALTRLADAHQPHIALLVDPCYAGVMASYASVADVIIAEPGARVGFAGQRVIEQTIRQKLPPNFQTAEFMLEHGMIDMVVARTDLRSTLTRLLRLYTCHSAGELVPSEPLTHVALNGRVHSASS